ncbi:MAG: hypothetical protein ACE5OR_02185, partial [bacterium]
VDGYQVTIGELTYRVAFTYGGSGVWKQRYVTRIPIGGNGSGVLSDGHYLLPIHYREPDGVWKRYHPENWYDIEAKTPLYDNI